MKKEIELEPLINYVPEPTKTWLEQPLTLGMFVPCDDDGNVLEKPIGYNNWIENGMPHDTSVWANDCIYYQQALDKVVFDGFEVFASKTWTEIRRGNVRIDFDDDEITVEIINSFSVEYEGLVKSISDLCGYGLKYYEQ